MTGQWWFAAMVLASCASVAQSPPVPAKPRGVSGYVLSPDGLPVRGTVVVQSRGTDIEKSFDQSGRFIVEAPAPGLYTLRVSAPEFTTQRLTVTVPPSGALILPPIRLSAASFLRLRLISPTEEPILWPRVVRASFDTTGRRLFDETGKDATDADGTTTIGPLPAGVTAIVVDVPPFARTQLPDVRVPRKSGLIESDPVRLEPGAVLHVDVVDGAGRPVSGHEVFLDHGVALSPLTLPPARTDAKGRATFDRLASGRYRIRTRALRQCGNRWPTVARSVTLTGAGVIQKTLPIGGVSLGLRLTTAGAPLPAAEIAVAAELPAQTPPAWLRESDAASEEWRWLLGYAGPSVETPCPGVTDADGQVTLAEIPPGPAHLRVRLANSSWVRGVTVPTRDGVLTLHLPAGITSIRALSADGGTPVSGAAVTWISGGSRVEATTSATGDALLEAVGDGPGVLSVRARGYSPIEQKVSAPPGIRHDIILAPTPEASIQCQVVGDGRSPLGGATVELIPEDPGEDVQVATTDAAGLVRFSLRSTGRARLWAGADGYALSVLQSVAVPPENGKPVVLELRRGYRIVATVERSDASNHAPCSAQSAGYRLGW